MAHIKRHIHITTFIAPEKNLCIKCVGHILRTGSMENKKNALCVLVM